MNERLQYIRDTEGNPQSVAALPLGELLNEAFSIYGGYFLRLIGLVAVVQVPANLFRLVPLHGLTGFFVVGIVSVMASVCVYGMVIWAVGQHYATGQMNIEACYRRVSWCLPSLAALAAALAMLSFLSSYLASAVITEQSLVAAGIVVLMSISLVVGVVYTIVAPQAIIVEDLRPVEAVKRSFALVKENWGTFFGRGMVVLLVLMGMGLILAIPAALISNIVAPGGATTTSTAIVFLSGTVVSILVPPVASIATTLLYFDLRVRKEDYDTEMLSREMAMAQAA